MKSTKVASLIVVVISLLTFDFSVAQTFNYNFQVSTNNYTNLDNKTVLYQNSDWRGQPIILPIGFQFAFLDSTFDTLSIESNGFIVFGGNKNYAITAFSASGPILDSVGNIKSSLSYQLDGSPGQRILKIEYKECGFSLDRVDESFNYQVWLFEDGGKVDIRIGSNNADLAITPFVGLINMNRNTQTSAFMVYGNPSSPQSQSLGEIDDIVYLNSVPVNGTIYSFTPLP